MSSAGFENVNRAGFFMTILFVLSKPFKPYLIVIRRTLWTTLNTLNLLHNLKIVLISQSVSTWEFYPAKDLWARPGAYPRVEHSAPLRLAPGVLANVRL